MGRGIKMGRGVEMGRGRRVGVVMGGWRVGVQMGRVGFICTCVPSPI